MASFNTVLGIKNLLGSKLNRFEFGFPIGVQGHQQPSARQQTTLQK
jgi:hypothetical protein